MEDFVSILKILGPMAVPFLAGIGLYALPSVRKKFASFFLPPHKRRDDSLIEMLLSQNEAQMDKFLEAYKENSSALQGSINALRAVAGEVEILTKNHLAHRTFVESAFTRVHERLDFLHERLKPNGHPFPKS